LTSSFVILFVRSTLGLELCFCRADRAARVSDSLPRVPSLMPMHVLEFVFLLALISFRPFWIGSDFVNILLLAKIIDSAANRNTVANQAFNLERRYEVV